MVLPLMDLEKDGFDKKKRDDGRRVVLW